jgi:hypothetical protein
MKKLKDTNKSLTAPVVGLWENELRITRKTAAFKKIDAYILDLSRNKDFLQRVRKIREDVGIPTNGFDYPKSIKEFKRIEKKFNYNEKYVKEVTDLACHCEAIAFPQFLDSFVLFGNTKAVLDYMHTMLSVIEIADINSIFYGELTDSLKDRTDGLRLSSITHPIGILIHPYMTQRDLVDAIKKLYKLQIEPIQKRYQKDKIMLGKARKKSNWAEERNKFIYENRIGKTKKEIISLVYEKFGGNLMDETYINKIIKDGRKLAGK